MPSVQSTYNSLLSAALEGMVANMESHNIISRVLQSSAGLSFGRIVLSGTTDIGCQTVVGATGSPVYMGVSVLDPTLRPPTSNDIYFVGDTVAIMTRGVIWVTTSVTVTAGQPAYYVPATGVFTNVSTSNTAIPRAQFDSSGASTTLVKLRLG